MSGPRRILFVSSTVAGGSGRSQRTLARALRDRGHTVAFLVDDERPAPLRRRIGERLADAAARFPRSTLLDHLATRIGTRLETVEHDGIEMWATPFPENGFPAAVRRFGPEVVVGSSMVRYSWRRIRGACVDAGLPTVLYIRGVASFGGLEVQPDPADAIVANARSLVSSIEAAGHRCSFVPSIVDTAATRVESTRRVALLVNPIETHGIDRLWELAAALPHIPFVIQESWELDDAQFATITARLDRHPNVTLRRRIPPGPDLYGDARVLLVPHRIDNRPRVVIETQANGIPALVSDFGGLREALGTGGAVLADDTAAWIEAVRAAFDDDDRYGAWTSAARAETDRLDLDPARIVEGFEAALDTAVAGRRGRPTAPLPVGTAGGAR